MATLTERAERILEVPTTRALSTRGTQDLIRDLLAEVERLKDQGGWATQRTVDHLTIENARLREHAEALAERADEVIDHTYCVPLSDELTTDDANELHNDLVHAVDAYRTAFPKEPTNG